MLMAFSDPSKMYYSLDPFEHEHENPAMHERWSNGPGARRIASDRTAIAWLAPLTNARDSNQEAVKKTFDATEI
jgi:hypothetical protein